VYKGWESQNVLNIRIQKKLWFKLKQNTLKYKIQNENAALNLLQTYEFLSSAEHKGRYFEGHHWLPYMEKKNTSQLFGYKHSSFVFSITKKFIPVWNNLMVSKLGQRFHFFGWTIPLSFPLGLFKIGLDVSMCVHVYVCPVWLYL